MSDLTQNLRKIGNKVGLKNRMADMATGLKAADRIEELEAALRAISKINPFTIPEGSMDMMELVDCILLAGIIAHKSLEKKDD